MNIENLRGFVTVAETLNFRSAAERLFLSQPALSRQIAELERELGTPLLERTTRSVRLTPAGEACLAGAESIVRMWDAMHSRALQTEVSTALRIGVYDIRISNYLVDSVGRFRREYPKIDLQIERGFHDGLREALLSGALDMACMIDPQLAASPLVEKLLLVEERPCVVIPLTHPLAGRENVSPRELQGERFLLPARSKFRDITQALLEVFTSQGIQPNVVAEDEDPDMAVIRVLNGEGVSLRVSDLGSLNRPKWDSVTQVPLEGERQAFRRQAFWLKRNKKAALRQFLLILQEELGRREKAD